MPPRGGRGGAPAKQPQALPKWGVYACYAGIVIATVGLIVGVMGVLVLMGEAGERGARTGGVRHQHHQPQRLVPRPAADHP